jgi:hypothetical protein
MVRDIPAPTHDYTFRLYQRNLPRRTVRDRARATAGQMDSKNGGPTPSPVSEHRDYLGQGPRRNPGNERADALAGMAAGRIAWSPVYHPSTSQAPDIGKIPKEQSKSGMMTPTTMVRRRSRHPPPPPPKKKSHVWIRPGMPLLGRRPRLGPATGDPRYTSRELEKGRMTNAGKQRLL